MNVFILLYQFQINQKERVRCEFEMHFKKPFFFKLKSEIISIYIRSENASGFGEVGGTPLPKISRNTPQPPGLTPRRGGGGGGGFLHLFSLKMSIYFAYFGLESGMVFERTTGVYEHIYRFNSK